MNWKDYEVEIKDALEKSYPNSNIFYNTSVIGRFSKAKRQVDILVEESIMQNRFRIVIDGKYFNKKVDVRDVELFIAYLQDCQADKGIMITTKGYSKAALKRAHFDPSRIELDIFNKDELGNFQCLWYGVIIDGAGLQFPAPFGCIIDTGGNLQNGIKIYQRGLSLKVAEKRNEFMNIKVHQLFTANTTISSWIKKKLENDKRKYYKYKQIEHRNFTSMIWRIKNNRAVFEEFYGTIIFPDFLVEIEMFSPVVLVEKNEKKLTNFIIECRTFMASFYPITKV